MEDIQDTRYGKMSQERFQATEETTSDVFSKSSAMSVETMQFLDLRTGDGNTQEKSWETISPSRGGCSTLDIGVSPRYAKESTLSQILQDNLGEAYSLSKRACQGILKRVTKRWKPIPEALRDAFEEVANDQ